jgi:hypothetical protein
MTCKQLAIKQHRTAHARAQGEQQHITNSAGGPEPVLTDQGAVGVISQGHRTLQQGLEPIGQGHIQPTRQIYGIARHPAGLVARPGVSHPNPIGKPLGIKLLHRRHNRRCHGTWHRWLGRGHLQLG